MTALRWFLSYLLPMLILAGITAAYYYRDQLSADWSRTLSWPVTQINDALQHQKLQLAVIEPVISTDLATKKSVPVAQSSEAPNEDNSLAITSDAQAISKIKSKTRTGINSASDEKPLMHPITPQKRIPTDRLALAPQSQHYMTPYPQQRMTSPVMRPMVPGLNPPNFNPGQRPAPTPPTQFRLNKKQLKLLYQARKAYWLNDLKKAEKYYLTLTRQLPDNPDIHGELGNLYYRERKLESVIKQYAIAAKLLIKHGHFWKLPPIMQIVSRFNPSKANEIMLVMRNRNTITTSNPGNNKKGK